MLRLSRSKVNSRFALPRYNMTQMKKQTCTEWIEQLLATALRNHQRITASYVSAGKRTLIEDYCGDLVRFKDPKAGRSLDDVATHLGLAHLHHLPRRRRVGQHEDGGVRLALLQPRRQRQAQHLPRPRLRRSPLPSASPLLTSPRLRPRC